MPARPYKARDKAKVEAAVFLAERWLVAVLRHEKFFALADLNQALAKLLERMNQRPFRKRDGTRASLYAAIDRPALQPLPAERYVLAEWKTVRVNIDYHVEVDGHYYSVPYSLVRQQLDVRRSAQVVELFHKGKRVASHQRSPLKGRHTTVAVHMPKAHQHYAEWSPQRLVLWAAKTGEATAQVVETILASRPHPQQGFRACLGIMRLGKRYGDGRLEAACQRAIRIGACSYKSIESILKHDLDQQPLPGPPAAAPVITHSNIRGAQYYHTNQGDPVC